VPDPTDIPRRQSNWALRATKWLDELRHGEQQVSLVLSLIIGALVGLVVVAFIKLTSDLAVHLYPAGAGGWGRILVPVLGALISGYFLYKYFPEARGSGIPQTKAAMFINDGNISLQTAAGKFGCCSLSLASGIALGREGPSVQISAGLTSVIVRHLGLSKEQVKQFIPVASSAALAAAFNTPIAAVIFTLEEVVGDLHANVLGSVVLSSATSWMTLHLLLGDEPLFHVPAYQLKNPIEFIFYAALGIIGGLGSVAFVKLLLGMRARFLRLPEWTQAWQPVVGGLVVGIMGFFIPDVMGVGYDVVERVLNGQLILGIVVLLAVLKIVATATCYASGNSGGIFGPSLFMGAMLGAAVGHVAQAIAPAHTARIGAYALVGMGTVFAGVIRTPLASVFMIFEVTRDYAIIVPLMISNLIAFFISYKLQPEAVYEALSHQDGIHLPTAAATRGARLMVAAAMRPVSAPPGPGQGAVDASEQPHVHPDHSLAIALERMGDAHIDVLPVVSRANVHLVLGEVTLQDILRVYGFDEAHGSP
jgi:chloride channel protein, CIC family